MISAFVATAGIPEPDLLWYGTVTTSSNGGEVRITSGTLVWQIEPLAGGVAILRSTTLTNLNGQFSFVLRLPCETPEPGASVSTNAVQLRSPAATYRRLAVTLDGQPLSLMSAAGEFSPLPSQRGRAERLDLRLGAAPLDSDHDGLGDAWEFEHFGGLSASADEDPDGDGVSNGAEFRAGTDPKNARSLFELIEIAEVPQGISIRWSSQPGRTYRVRRSPTLLATAADYGVLQTGLAATPPANQFTDTTAGAGAQFFYLIEVEE